MSITEFLTQAHPATLDWIEESLMEKLLEVDKWQRANEMAKELRQVIKQWLKKKTTSDWCGSLHSTLNTVLIKLKL